MAVTPARGATAVDAYWSDWTVNSTPFESAEESERYLEWRSVTYPLFRWLMDDYGSHQGETVLDYGCGPGNDVIGFLLYSGADRVIGLDVSAKALSLTRHRIGLHQIPEARYQLIQASDSRPAIALEEESVDHVHSLGVLHHTSNPGEILAEFRRVMRPGATGSVMVYNRDSVWFHLFVAYQRMILEGAYTGLSVDEAFARTTDGEDCPIARCYRPREFIDLVETAGLEATFEGGFYSRLELDLMETLFSKARGDRALAAEHRSFLRSLLDPEGFPTHNGKYAGVGASFRIRRP